MEGRVRSDLLGVLMTESVFGAHLVYEESTGLFHVAKLEEKSQVSIN